MKKLVLLFTLALFAGCSEGTSTDTTIEPAEPKSYTVSFGMEGEITIENTPLTRASTDDLYGIQVWSKPAISTDDYVAYAYGLFDDKSKMTIKLLEGHLYKFQSTMVVDGKNVVRTDNLDDNFYWYPFAVEQETQLENKFIWSTSNMHSIKYGLTWTTGADGGSEYADRPFVDRYYGEATDYAPVENGSVMIDMKRTVFGVKFIVNDLTEGELIINMEDSPQLTIVSGTTEIEKLVTFNSVESAWITDNYTEDVPITITWKKADGVVVPLINQTVTFTRKQLSTITIKIKDAGVGSDMDLILEAGDLADGEDHVFESGEGVETPVEP